ncbi:MAG: hypothetical protein WC635_13445 [Bacteriovorax sp.]|jgi:hypothetical protein
MKSRLIFTVVLASFFQSISATETDGFTNRNEPLADSADIINSRANQYVQKSLETLNAAGAGCVEEDLYKELRIYFNNHSKGKLLKDILHDESIPKRKITLDNSVFKTWTPWDGLGMGLTFIARSGITISPILNFNNEILGADKFEHFFGQGYFYFTANYAKDKGTEKAVKTGIFKEKTILGGNKFGNGVFSYGDLSANFNGMRFWNHMLQQNDDVLGADRNLGPYIICQDQKWVQSKKIDFKDYMDASMDESINCSKFPAKKTAERFLEQVKSLGMNCPIDPKKLDEMAEKYGELSKWIINEDGVGVIKYFGEFKNKN